MLQHNLIYRITILLLPFAAGMLLTGCGSSDCEPGFQCTESGLQYKLHVQNEGTAAEVGDVLKIHLVNTNADDSILSSTYADVGQPIDITVSEPSFQGDLMEGFLMLSEGDSATFLVSADSVVGDTKLEGRMAELIQKGSLLKYHVKVEGVYSEKEMAKKQQEAHQGRIRQEVKRIEAYLEREGLDAEALSSGVHYVVQQAGTGERPKPGSRVSVHYTGKLLSGEQFDASYDRGRPITFKLGDGSMIPGWEEGISYLREGAKAIIIIPSPLAYGEKGRGDVIPPHSIILFEVEIVNIAKGAPTS